MPRELAEAVVAALSEAGVDTLFGLPGGGPNLEKVGAAMGAGMGFVLAHTETAACITASTYGLLRGVPGVCIVTRGPGLASAVNGAAQATLDRFPLVLISDTVPAAHAERVPHQRLAQVQLMRPVTKWSGTLGPDRARDLVARAAALAAIQPAGAVHLDFDPTGSTDPPPAVPAPPALDRAAVDAARRLVQGARRPVFLLGAEALAWTDQVRATVRAGAAPALMTYQAKGLIPDSWPQAAGLFTNGAAERPLIERADLIVAVGLDPVEPIPAPWGYDAPVLALHPWAVTDRYVQPDAEVIAAVGPALDALADSWHSDWEPDAGRAHKQRVQEAVWAQADGLTPHQVVDTVLKLSPPRVRATVDAGAHMLVVMPLWPVDEPRRLLISNGLATMGFAVPAAIAAALADPETPVVAFVGDGGLGMTLAELETIARLGLNVTTVVFNDSALSLIEIKQAAHHGGPAAVRYAPTDFAAIARGFGLPGTVAGDAHELADALAQRWSGPRLVDARVNPAVYPHVIKATRG